MPRGGWTLQTETWHLGTPRLGSRRWNLHAVISEAPGDEACSHYRDNWGLNCPFMGHTEQEVRESKLPHTGLTQNSIYVVPTKNKAMDRRFWFLCPFIPTGMLWGCSATVGPGRLRLWQVSSGTPGQAEGEWLRCPGSPGLSQSLQAGLTAPLRKALLLHFYSEVSRSEKSCPMSPGAFLFLAFPQLSKWQGLDFT